MELLSQGAEAMIFKLEDGNLRKKRQEKTYRLNIIDTKLRKFRTKREFKVLTKLVDVKVNVPKPLKIYEKEFCFDFEFIEGNILKSVLDKKLLLKAFEEIIKMHNFDVVHGDLTTLNMIEKKGEIFLIDFGLAEFSSDVEQKAVDLNLFFTCIKNEHPNLFEMKEKLCSIYEKEAENGSKVIERVQKIEQRGRNKAKN